MGPSKNGGRRLATLVAVLAMGVAVAHVASAGGDLAAEEVALVGFTQTSRLVDQDQQQPAVQQVQLWVRHRAGMINALHTRTTAAGKVVEERHWQASRPDTTVVRDWRNCTEAPETPDPRYQTLTALLEDTFGPRNVPASAQTAADGSASWELEQDGLRQRLVDHGKPYPGRTVEQYNANGDIAIVIDNASLGVAPGLPTWAGAPCVKEH